MHDCVLRNHAIGQMRGRRAGWVHESPCGMGLYKTLALPLDGFEIVFIRFAFDSYLEILQSPRHKVLTFDATMPLVDALVSMWSFCPTGGQVQLPPSYTSSSGGSVKEVKPATKSG